ncbi:hypothetical protein GT037_010628 [Alternaria burnsii]|uniref:Uncharacterized protein n=1 Tax=Alternaria burnsii TaxID=1187904 RepID=A0A8H7EBB7_9PLEO|nr:uncharacterized protein GT037_010628 [Alternaria burnsii]KAF7671303.1 hypothetical protein GT037_010628 [Alternaria burnsii]
MTRHDSRPRSPALRTALTTEHQHPRFAMSGNGMLYGTWAEIKSVVEDRYHACTSGETETACHCLKRPWFETPSPRAHRVSDLTTVAAGQTIVKLNHHQNCLSRACRSWIVRHHPVRNLDD